MLVIGKDDGSLERADKIENYFGLETLLSGNELISTGKRQVLNLGGSLIRDEIFSIGFDKNFIITGRNKEYNSKSVILATGSFRKSPKFKGFEEFVGKGISYCAVCDAFFYRNKNVAVLGSGDYAIHEIHHLLPIAKSVVLLTNGQKFSGKLLPNDLQVITNPLKELIGENNLQSVIFSDSSSIKIDGLFVALGSASAIDLASKIGAITEGNSIQVNDKMETSIPGLFAAGDCTGGVLQISVAVGEGAKAGLSAINYIHSLKNI